jgi:hypothetical protein
MENILQDPTPPGPSLLRNYRIKDNQWENLAPPFRARILQVWEEVRKHFTGNVTPLALDLGYHLPGLQSYVYDALWNEGWVLAWEEEEERDPFSRNFSVLWVSIPSKLAR